VEAALVRLASGVGYQSVQSLIEQLNSGDGVSSAPARSSAGRGASDPEDAKKKVTPPSETASPSVSSVSARPATAAPQFPAPPALSRGAGDSSPRTAAPAPARSSSPQSQSPPVRPATAPSPAASPSGDTLKEAASQPLVRAALEIFDGSLVNVEKVKE
jgi:hypothetical protein